VQHTTLKVESDHHTLRLVSMKVAFHATGTHDLSAAPEAYMARGGVMVPKKAMATAFLPDLTIMPSSVFTPMTKICSMKAYPPMVVICTHPSGVAKSSPPCGIVAPGREAMVPRPSSALASVYARRRRSTAPLWS